MLGWYYPSNLQEHFWETFPFSEHSRENKGLRQSSSRGSSNRGSPVDSVGIGDRTPGVLVWEEGQERGGGYGGGSNGRPYDRPGGNRRGQGAERRQFDPIINSEHFDHSSGATWLGDGEGQTISSPPSRVLFENRPALSFCNYKEN